MGLTARNIRFCEEYIIDLNAKEAAIRAGYKGTNAIQEGSRILNRPYVKLKIQQLMNERSQRTAVTADSVIEELAKVAFFDIRTIYDANGAIINIKDFPHDAAASVAGIEVYKGKSTATTTRIKNIRLHNKIKALESLARHLGIFNDKLTIGAGEELKNLYKTVMQSK